MLGEDEGRVRAGELPGEDVHVEVVVVVVAVVDGIGAKVSPGAGEELLRGVEDHQGGSHLLAGIFLQMKILKLFYMAREVEDREKKSLLLFEQKKL